MKRAKADTKTKTIKVTVSKETLKIPTPYTVPAAEGPPLTYFPRGQAPHTLTVKASTATVRRKK